MNGFGWISAWTPYALIRLIGSIDDKNLVTPLTSQLPQFSAFNPLLTLICNPNVRNIISEKFPSLGISKCEIPDVDDEAEKN